MTLENFEAFEARLEEASNSSITIDVDPNWFNGSCIKTKDNDAVYLVMKGEKRHVPNPTTYNNLFKDWKSIHDGDKLGTIWNKIVDGIPTGDEITDDAILIKADNSDPIYLLTNNKKYWITDMKQFNDCNFKSGGQKSYPAIVINAIPSGENDVFKPTEMK
ncbi:MAG: hypothetical protein NC485_14120 [Ruminococcus flavefaciens]|nr:hypothetical protein [Ruminococcus flavefaciens]